MLAYPSFALLKENLPEAKLYVLATPYTKPLADVCPWIDTLIIDSEPRASWRSGFTLAEVLRKEQFDAVITLFSTSRVALATSLAKIPYRLAPATKFAQVFYNHRLVQRRSRSEKPEHIYNQDLVRHFLETQDMPIKKEPCPPYLHFDEKYIRQLKSHFCKRNRVEPGQGLIFIHPGSGGSSGNFTIEQFAKLARNLKSEQGHHFIISAGPDELPQAKTVSALLGITPHTLYHSTEGLMAFSEHIQFADLFISGSTGPLHIAGALDIPTVAFYTRRRSASSLRWQTLNSPSKRLSFSPKKEADPEDMQSIDVLKTAQTISEHYLHFKLDS
ncbi:glycosyltransferase family 9 protein [Nitrospira defluvii]|nr:glycosyltransferase family 9 protein [Nitrospira defluvii]